MSFDAHFIPFLNDVLTWQGAYLGTKVDIFGITEEFP